MTLGGDTLVDITRSVSRVAQGSFSGVDRVERAYIEEALTGSGRSFFLARILGGYALLAEDGMRQFVKILDGEVQLGRTDLIGQLGRRQSPMLRRAESEIRRLGHAIKGKHRLATLLTAYLQPGFTYFNTGHSNMVAATMAGLKTAGAAKIAVLIHDIIPLQFPEFSRPGTPDLFRQRLLCVAENADLLIYNSQDTQQRTEGWLAEQGHKVASVSAPLGLSLPAALPQAKEPKVASFVMLGTIEPRKNHLLLLNIWRQFGDELPQEEIPHLHLIGRAGWENENIVDILERAPFMGRTVFNHGYLSDTKMVALVGQARALLFPSFAEGFGYPLAEALSLGKPVICSDLPAFREIDDEQPVFLDPLDGPRWKQTILDMAASAPQTIPGFEAPGWSAHFAEVRAALSS